MGELSFHFCLKLYTLLFQVLNRLPNCPCSFLSSSYDYLVDFKLWININPSLTDGLNFKLWLVDFGSRHFGLRLTKILSPQVKLKYIDTELMNKIISQHWDLCKLINDVNEAFGIDLVIRMLYTVIRITMLLFTILEYHSADELGEYSFLSTRLKFHLCPTKSGVVLD